jgi:hypothetical protein
MAESKSSSSSKSSGKVTVPNVDPNARSGGIAAPEDITEENLDAYTRGDSSVSIGDSGPGDQKPMNEF